MFRIDDIAPSSFDGNKMILVNQANNEDEIISAIFSLSTFDISKIPPDLIDIISNDWCCFTSKALNAFSTICPTINARSLIAFIYLGKMAAILGSKGDKSQRPANSPISIITGKTFFHFEKPKTMNLILEYSQIPDLSNEIRLVNYLFNLFNMKHFNFYDVILWSVQLTIINENMINNFPNIDEIKKLPNSIPFTRDKLMVHQNPLNFAIIRFLYNKIFGTHVNFPFNIKNNKLDFSLSPKIDDNLCWRNSIPFNIKISSYLYANSFPDLDFLILAKSITKIPIGIYTLIILNSEFNLSEITQKDVDEVLNIIKSSDSPYQSFLLLLLYSTENEMFKKQLDAIINNNSLSENWRNAVSLLSKNKAVDRYITKATNGNIKAAKKLCYFPECYDKIKEITTFPLNCVKIYFDDKIIHQNYDIKAEPTIENIILLYKLSQNNFFITKDSYIELIKNCHTILIKSIHDAFSASDAEWIISGCTNFSNSFVLPKYPADLIFNPKGNEAFISFLNAFYASKCLENQKLPEIPEVSDFFTCSIVYTHFLDNFPNFSQDEIHKSKLSHVESAFKADKKNFIEKICSTVKRSKNYFQVIVEVLTKHDAYDVFLTIVSRDITLLQQFAIYSKDCNCNFISRYLKEYDLQGKTSDDLLQIMKQILIIDDSNTDSIVYKFIATISEANPELAFEIINSIPLKKNFVETILKNIQNIPSPISNQYLAFIKEIAGMLDKYQCQSSFTPMKALDNDWNEDYDVKEGETKIRRKTKRTIWDYPDDIGECTQIVTGHDYQTQHWFHCITCGLVDNTGCCIPCALRCHRNHDITYAKNSGFYCDCYEKIELCKFLQDKQAALNSNKSDGLSKRNESDSNFENQARLAGNEHIITDFGPIPESMSGTEIMEYLRSKHQMRNQHQTLTKNQKKLLRRQRIMERMIQQQQLQRIQQQQQQQPQYTTSSNTLVSPGAASIRNNNNNNTSTFPARNTTFGNTNANNRGTIPFFVPDPNMPIPSLYDDDSDYDNDNSNNSENGLFMPAGQYSTRNNTNNASNKKYSFFANSKNNSSSNNSNPFQFSFKGLSQQNTNPQSSFFREQPNYSLKNSMIFNFINVYQTQGSSSLASNNNQQKFSGSLGSKQSGSTSGGKLKFAVKTTNVQPSTPKTTNIQPSGQKTTNNQPSGQKTTNIQSSTAKNTATTTQPAGQKTTGNQPANAKAAPTPNNSQYSFSFRLAPQQSNQADQPTASIGSGSNGPTGNAGMKTGLGLSSFNPPPQAPQPSFGSSGTFGSATNNSSGTFGSGGSTSTGTFGMTGSSGAPPPQGKFMSSKFATGGIISTSKPPNSSSGSKYLPQEQIPPPPPPPPPSSYGNKVPFSSAYGTKSTALAGQPVTSSSLASGAPLNPPQPQMRIQQDPINVLTAIMIISKMLEVKVPPLPPLKNELGEGKEVKDIKLYGYPNIEASQFAHFENTGIHCVDANSFFVSLGSSISAPQVNISAAIGTNYDKFIICEGQNAKIYDSKTNQLLSSAELRIPPLRITVSPLDGTIFAISSMFQVYVYSLNESNGTIEMNHKIELMLEELGRSLSVVSVEWVPLEPLHLAITCTSFVKIYDIPTDCISPIACFNAKDRITSSFLTVYEDEPYVFAATSNGRIYYDKCNVDSNDGPSMFYNSIPISLMNYSSSKGIAISYCEDADLLFVSTVGSPLLIAHLGEIMSQQSKNKLKQPLPSQRSAFGPPPPPPQQNKMQFQICNVNINGYHENLDFVGTYPDVPSIFIMRDRNSGEIIFLEFTSKGISNFTLDHPSKSIQISGSGISIPGFFITNGIACAVGSDGYLYKIVSGKHQSSTVIHLKPSPEIAQSDGNNENDVGGDDDDEDDDGKKMKSKKKSIDDSVDDSDLNPLSVMAQQASLASAVSSQAASSQSIPLSSAQNRLASSGQLSANMQSGDINNDFSNSNFSFSINSSDYIGQPSFEISDSIVLNGDNDDDDDENIDDDDDIDDDEIEEDDEGIDFSDDNSMNYRLMSSKYSVNGHPYMPISNKFESKMKEEREIRASKLRKGEVDGFLFEVPATFWTESRIETSMITVIDQNRNECSLLLVHRNKCFHDHVTILTITSYDAKNVIVGFKLCFTGDKKGSILTKPESVKIMNRRYIATQNFQRDFCLPLKKNEVGINKSYNIEIVSHSMDLEIYGLDVFVVDAQTLDIQDKNDWMNDSSFITDYIDISEIKCENDVDYIIQSMSAANFLPLQSYTMMKSKKVVNDNDNDNDNYQDKLENVIKKEDEELKKLFIWMYTNSKVSLVARRIIIKALSHDVKRFEKLCTDAIIDICNDNDSKIENELKKLLWRDYAFLPQEQKNRIGNAIWKFYDSDCGALGFSSAFLFN